MVSKAPVRRRRAPVVKDDGSLPIWWILAVPVVLGAIGMIGRMMLAKG